MNKDYKQNSNYLSEDEEARINAMPDEEFNNMMSQKHSEFQAMHDKFIDQLSAMIHYNYINDQKIIEMISDSGINFWPYYITYAIFMLAAIAFIMYFQLPEFAAMAFLAICIVAVAKMLISAWKKNGKLRTQRAEQIYKESYFFESQFIKVSKKLRNTRMRGYFHAYYIHFKDENGKRRKNEIPEEEYKIIKEKLRCGQPVYVLKYPKIKNNKFGYMAYHIEGLENHSVIRFRSWH